jgi:hypothetical protein
VLSRSDINRAGIIIRLVEESTTVTVKKIQAHNTLEQIEGKDIRYLHLTVIFARK